MTTSKKLTDTSVKVLKATEKMYSMSDSIPGLRIFVYPHTGHGILKCVAARKARYWKIAYCLHRTR